MSWNPQNGVFSIPTSISFYNNDLGDFSLHAQKCSTADIPDHALVEDQSEDIATDVKFCIWRLKKTHTHTELVFPTESKQ